MESFTNRYLDLVLERLKLPSDYALAELLELTPQAIYKMRGGGAMGPATAAKIAKLLEVDAEKVVVEIELERASTPELQEVWKRIARKVAIVAGIGAGLTLLVQIARSSGADPHQVLEAMSVLAMPLASPVYYVNYAPVILAVAIVGLTLATLARARLFPRLQRLTTA